VPYVKVVSLDELPPGELIEVELNKKLYAICNVAGEIRVIHGICPHHGGPLGQGALEGSLITCPWHAWQFDTATGVCPMNGELRVPTYPVRVEAGQILVDLPAHA
jgi:nitrite reductase (NADH) small subunit